jgi:serine/threonine-protein kinase RsbW
MVDAWGHQFTLKPGSTALRRISRYKGLDLKINADVNYLGMLRDFISRFCKQEGLDEIQTNDVVLAIEEILHNLIEHSNDFDPWQFFRIRLDFQKKQLKIRIRDSGDPYDVTAHQSFSIRTSVLKGLKRGVGGFLVNQLMDQVKYQKLKNYNQLTMVKRFKPPLSATEP